MWGQDVVWTCWSQPCAAARWQKSKGKKQNKKTTSSAAGSTPDTNSPGAGADEATTIQLRNLPRDFTREKLLTALSGQGFARDYNFVNLPREVHSGKCFGYAFVNFVSAERAVSAVASFQGFSWGVRTGTARLSDRDQGLEAQIKRNQDKAVMHADVPDEYKPALFSKGLRIPFPQPTTLIS